MSVRRQKRRDPATGAVQERWMVDVMFQHPDGRMERIRKVSPVQTRRGAEDYERQLRNALLGGSYGKEVKDETPTLAEFVPRFLTYAENNNKPSTLSAKKQALEVHIIPAFGEQRLDQITPAMIEEFKASMRKKVSGARKRKAAPTKWAIKKRHGAPPGALSDKSINNTLSILRTLLRLACDWRVIDQPPPMRLFKAAKPGFDFLNFDEAVRLINAAEPEWRTLLIVALKSGLRLGELIGLQWNDVDLVQGRINVRRTIWRGHQGTPKGGRSRTVSVPASVVAALKGHRHLKGPFVFCAQDGRPFTEGQLKLPLSRALRRSGISRDEGRIGWHDLRHTYGSHLAMKGVPMKAIQELMGHATIEMTMRYAHLSPETRQDAVRVLDEQPDEEGVRSGYGNRTATGGTDVSKLP